MRGLLRRIERWRHWPAVALALATYLPLLATHRGKVGADTKTYLYLDPSRLLGDAPWLWDTGVGLGTVTHQNIGYLWPSGPYYWLANLIGLPDWVAQRLWLATILFTAGLGVRFLLRTIKWQLPGATVAMFAYALTPYVLHYGARISVILLPFAGLPWLIALLIRSLRRGGWKDPAAFALVTVTVGGINATSLLLVLVGPAMWLPYAIWVRREVRLRQAIGACARIGVLTAITSVWWVAGLSIQGKFGIEILKYTEQYEVVAKASTAAEVFRGLGYWFFYGSDSLGSWIQAARGYAENPFLLFVSFLLPSLAMLSGFITRFRHRAYFVALIVAGFLISIASHPWDSPSPAGQLFKLASKTNTGLAFRSTPRAEPLMILGFAVLLGAGVAAVGKLSLKTRLPVACAVLALIAINQTPLFTGKMVDDNLQRDENVPAYWVEAAKALDDGSHDTRVLEMPGIDFASYRWGNTVDPITPGLMDRDYAARELIPYGSPASASLMNALDFPYQEGTQDPAALAPIARLMGIGDIALRFDLRTGRYRTPRPRRMWQDFMTTPGLTLRSQFGGTLSTDLDPVQPLEDEMALGTPLSFEQPPPVAVFSVDDPLPMIRSVPADAPIVMAGDAQGLVAAAGAGLVDPGRPIVFSASLAGKANQRDLRTLLAEPDAELVVTDSNRKQAWRWGSVRENHGYTERADESALVDDITDNRLEVFGPVPVDSKTRKPDYSTYTINEQQGAATIDASSYGNAVTYVPGDRPSLAFDGNLRTTWRVGAFKDVNQDFLRVNWKQPTDVDAIRIIQSQRNANRWVTKVRILVDGQPNKPGSGMEFVLDDTSRSPKGQLLKFPNVTASHLTIAIVDTNLKELASYKGVSEVGFAEVQIGTLRVTDEIRPPTDLLDAAGAKSIDSPLSYVFRRQYSSPEEVVIDDEETQMHRVIETPVARSFSLTGKARIPTELPDQTIDALAGIPDAAHGGITSTSSSRLPSLLARASSAIDGDPSTAWQSPVNHGLNSWVQYTAPKSFTVDKGSITFVADGQHSVPRVIHFEVDGKKSEQIRMPDRLGDGSDGNCLKEKGEAVYDLTGVRRGHVEKVSIDLKTPLAGKSVKVVVDDMWHECSRDWFGGGPTFLPVGIAELTLPGLRKPASPAQLPAVCRTNLVTIDGSPVGVELKGTVEAALNRDLIPFDACAPATAPTSGPSSAASAGKPPLDGMSIALDTTRHVLSTASGLVTGIDVDAVVLSSAKGGSARDTRGGTVTTESATPKDPIVATKVGRVAWKIDTSKVTTDRWIIAGQSSNAGWHLRTADGTDLGPSTLVNGYANGWKISAETARSGPLRLEWEPQSGIWLALWASLIGALVCLVLMFVPVRLGGGTPAAIGIAPIRTIRVISPADAFGSPVARNRSIGISVGAALLATGLLAWWAGPILGVLTYLGLRTKRGWMLLRIVSLGLIAMGCGYVIVKQLLNGYGLEFEWPRKFEAAHFPILIGVSLLAVDVVIENMRAGWRRETDR